MSSQPILSVRGLSVSFTRGGLFRSQEIKAVDSVSFHVAKGETVGLVGESGSGKSTILRAIAGLVAGMEGVIELNGVSVASASGETLRKLAATRQLVFQDPDEALNPRLSVGASVLEPLLATGKRLKGSVRAEFLSDLFQKVGLPRDCGERFPHRFSGGQRQRILLARALSVRPQLLLLDEPTSALDVSVQAVLLGLMDELASEFSMARLIVSHDLAVIRHIADRVLVLRHGKVVEEGGVGDVLDAPKHPYTQSLRAAALGQYDGSEDTP